MNGGTSSPAHDDTANIARAARYLPPWGKAELAVPPAPQRRRILATLGPGVLLAGSSIGAGEWLFGPAVTAQYGGTLLWLATISIVVQVFYNLEVMRYALYCGEPVIVGFFRTWPGPQMWTLCYMTLFIAHIWPFMASNAAVPLAAAFLGHLPGAGEVHIAGWELPEAGLVKVLGFGVFYAAFVPLVFGGKVYTMLERLMTIKLVLLLGFLIVVTGSMISLRNAREIVTGFFRFGTIPLRAETVVAGNHFTFAQRVGEKKYILKGSIEDGNVVIATYRVEPGRPIVPNNDPQKMVPEVASQWNKMVERARALARPGEFLVEAGEKDPLLTIAGTIARDGVWHPETYKIGAQGEAAAEYRDLADVPEPYRDQAQALVANQGFVREQLWSYWHQHGRLPDLDWGMLAAFAGIAGAGGLSNALLSNYARDKGWGMGDKIGAIPSAIGGRTIALSHVGKVFDVDTTTLPRWRGWYRHILRDQVGLWMVCSFIGMALPCMMSLEFIRNVPVADNRVAAMTAEGIASHFPSYRQWWWSITLLVSFLALAPNAMMSGDLIARLWTDILWVGSRHAQKLAGHQVRYIYYGILGIYCLWGSAALAWLNPLQIAKVGAVLQNIALGFSSFHTLYVNRTLLPPELRPNWLMQTGLVATGVFFLAITAVAVWQL